MSQFFSFFIPSYQEKSHMNMPSYNTPWNLFLCAKQSPDWLLIIVQLSLLVKVCSVDSILVTLHSAVL